MIGGGNRYGMRAEIGGIGGYGVCIDTKLMGEERGLLNCSFAR